MFHEIFWIQRTIKIHRLKSAKIFKATAAKGQLISKGLFGVIVSTKKPTSFLRISALASKKSSKQKTLLYIYDK